MRARTPSPQSNILRIIKSYSHPHFLFISRVRAHSSTPLKSNSTVFWRGSSSPPQMSGKHFNFPAGGEKGRKAREEKYFSRSSNAFRAWWSIRLSVAVLAKSCPRKKGRGKRNSSRVLSRQKKAISFFSFLFPPPSVIMPGS